VSILNTTSLSAEGKGKKVMTEIPFPQSLLEDLQKVEENLASLTNVVGSSHVSEMLRHVVRNGGKRIRPALALMAGAFYKYNFDALVTLASSVELLHTATLLHDDTIDHSMLRRGRQTVNSLWGGGRAILVGDYLFSKSAEMTVSTGNKRVINLFAWTLMSISSAELEQNMADYRTRETRENYYRWITVKTSAIFTMATESAAILSEAPEESVAALRDYGLNLGLAFQIIDDILDFTGAEDEMGKPVGSDLMQGTLTLPSILLIEREPKNNPVRLFLENKDNQAHLKAALDRITNSEVLPECYRIAREHCQAACQNLKKLQNKPMRKAMEDLAEFVVQRNR
jgi:octaprenyl-diphosphate synthase